MIGPEVSVIIPAYRSYETIALSLETLAAQTYRDFETLVVDSSPDDRCEVIVQRFPHVALLRHATRLFPQAARNRGAAVARGRLLVFTDSDVSFDRRWLEILVQSHREKGGVISGAIDCFGKGWLDSGVHLCKFSKWLPGGAPRPTDCAPTANLLVTRALYDAIGGFRDEGFVGDVTFSWQARRLGEQLRFEPAAAVFHHHHHRIAPFVRERFKRGFLFSGVRTRWHHNRRRIAFFYLVVSVFPIRLGRILLLVAGHAWRASWTRRYLSTFPVLAVGWAAWLAGESVGYVRFLLGHRTRVAQRTVSESSEKTDKPKTLKDAVSEQ
jgi:GT2 family glycosyltransferase